MIDVNLSGEIAAPVSQALSEKGIPLILVTGYEEPPLDGFPAVHKPFGASKLRDAIIQYLAPKGRAGLRGKKGS